MGEYQNESLLRDGFIHFSQHNQVLGVATAFYKNQKDLVILVVETDLLKADLKFEAPVHPGQSTASTTPSAGQLFPHLYGPLNFDAVLDIVDFPQKADGSFELPF